MTLSPLIDLDDAKAQLEITSSVDDTELLDKILSATELINTECGVSIATSFTESLVPNRDKFGRYVFLATYVPLLSIDSMVGEITGLSTMTCTIANAEAGTFGPPWGVPILGPQTVTYTAGRTEVPASLQDACKLLVQWLWESKRGAQPLPVMGLEEPDMQPANMGYPPQAIHLMRPYLLGPRI